jgi:hypothetical protein
MSRRNGCYLAALGGLTAVLLAGAAPNQPASQPQEPPAAAEPPADSGQGFTAFERESLAVDRAANGIAQRANLIAEAQRSYAYWQLLLGGAGVAFTAVAAIAAIAAAIYAKRAAHAAALSAQADNASLSATLKAAEDARADAKEQAARFKKQMGAQDQLIEYTAKTAYAMEHAATGMRGAASAARRSADVAERSLLVAQAPSLSFKDVEVRREPPRTKAPIEQMGIVVTWENVGTTIARNVDIRTCIIVFAGEPPSDFAYPEGPATPRSLTFVTARQPIESRINILAMEKWVEAYEKSHTVLLYGSAEYDDAFPGTARHRAEFCIRFEVANDPRSRETTPLGPAETWGPFNGTDGDCYRQPAQRASKNP